MDVEVFQHLKAQSRRKKRRNLSYGTTQLRNAGYLFQIKNEGLHLIVTSKDSIIDYWPSTGKWIDRKTKLAKRGVRPLLNYLGEQNE